MNCKKKLIIFDILKLVNINLCIDGYRYGVVEMMWLFYL